MFQSIYSESPTFSSVTSKDFGNLKVKNQENVKQFEDQFKIASNDTLFKKQLHLSLAGSKLKLKANGLLLG